MGPSVATRGGEPVASAAPERLGRFGGHEAPSSFAGVYPHGFDAKFRIVIPSLVRAAFADGGYLFQMPREGNYVALFPTVRWEGWLTDLRDWMRAQNELDDDVLSNVLDRARPFLLDVQGRVSIPEDFRSFARLGDVVELRGRLSHLALLRGPVAAHTADSDEAVMDFVNGQFR